MKLFLFFILFPFISLAQQNKHGILGQQAPDWQIHSWIDENGNDTQVKLADYKAKVIYLLCFQSWCPGCHSIGFPTLTKVMDHFKGNNDVEFVSIQTVFEGFGTNTKGKLRDTQLRYDLEIPMGHDPGNKQTYNRSSILYNYRTGGTPWVVIIDQQGKVVYNDYHIKPGKAIELIGRLVKQ